MALLLVSVAACGDDGGDNPADEIDASVPKVCPQFLEFTADGAASRVDLGWSGQAYGSKFPDGTGFRVETFDCDDDCRRCQVRGPVLDEGPDDNFQRCVNRQERVCTASEDCCDEDEAGCTPGEPAFPGGPVAACRQFYTPPLSSATSCSSFFFEPAVGEGDYPIQGSFDFATGYTEFIKFSMQQVILPGTSCNHCNGGTCVGGASDGEACIAHGRSNGAFAFTTSFDCAQPYLFQNPGNTDNVQTASISWEMNEERPDCSAVGYEDKECWCGECSGDALRSCFGDLDCLGAGSCVGGSVIPTKPDKCPGPIEAPTEPGNCLWNPATQTGACEDPNNLGQPLASKLACIPAEGVLTAAGEFSKEDGFWRSTVAGIQCLAASGDATTDGVLGLPGILFVLTPYRVVTVESGQ